MKLECGRTQARNSQIRAGIFLLESCVKTLLAICCLLHVSLKKAFRYKREEEASKRPELLRGTYESSSCYVAGEELKPGLQIISDAQYQLPSGRFMTYVESIICQTIEGVPESHITSDVKEHEVNHFANLDRLVAMQLEYIGKLIHVL